MRTLWNVISFLALVHLLALVMFIGWLWQSGRLTRERLYEAKAIFAPTVMESRAAADKAEQEAKAELKRLAEEEQQSNPPADSAAQIQLASMIAQQEEQARRRLEDDKRVLLEQLAQATLQVNQKQRELDQQREQWESATKDDQQRKNDEQFLQIVKQYEQLSPKQGKRMLMELVSQNKTQQAVAYLRAMNMRAASRILKEFKTDSEIALATELLEKLRTYGKTDEQATDPQRGPALAAASAPHAGSSNANAPADDSR